MHKTSASLWVMELSGMARLGGSAAWLGGAAARAGGSPSGGGGGWSLFGGATGITRLFESDIGSQISGLLPAALIALTTLVWLSWRSPRTDKTLAAALLWGGWLVVTAVVFSYMSGIIHRDYTVALAPAIAALAGIGAVALWRIRHTWAARIMLAGTLLITAAWAWVLLDRSAGWLPWLRVVIAIAAAGAAAMTWRAGGAGRHLPGRAALAIAPLSLPLIAGLGGRLAYSIDTAAMAHTGSTLTAGLSVTGSSGGPGGGQPAAGTLHGPSSAGEYGTAPRQHRHVRHGAVRCRGPGPGGPGADGQRQRRPVPAARIRRVRLPLGRGHHRLDQRGLPRAGQQRGPGHGHRRLHRQRPGPDARPVREARLRSRDPLLRGQRIRRAGRGGWFRVRRADHRVGESTLHRKDHWGNDGV